jgi:hypothetical protein
LGRSKELCVMTRSGVAAAEPACAKVQEGTAARQTLSPSAAAETPNRRNLCRNFCHMRCCPSCPQARLGHEAQGQEHARCGKRAVASRSLRWHNPDQVRGVCLSPAAQRSQGTPGEVEHCRRGLARYGTGRHALAPTDSPNITALSSADQVQIRC